MEMGVLRNAGSRKENDYNDNQPGSMLVTARFDLAIGHA